METKDKIAVGLVGVSIIAGFAVANFEKAPPIETMTPPHTNFERMYPSITPTLTVTPQVQNVDTVISTPKPTATPTPRPSYTPPATPIPTPIRTITPTFTPMPTTTPSPTESPSSSTPTPPPVVSPSPSSTPTPTPTSTPTPRPSEETFKPKITLSGERIGNEVRFVWSASGYREDLICTVDNVAVPKEGTMKFTSVNPYTFTIVCRGNNTGSTAEKSLTK